jgi:hypothetical protein
MNPLKYLALSVLIIIFVFDLSFAEDKQYGFQDIPFGASYEEVNQKLKEIYEEKHKGDSRLSFSFYVHKSNLYENSIQFDHFDLGNRDIYTIAIFHFDQNNKFYSFHFETIHRISRSDAYGDGKYLTEVFTNKYGKPSQCYKLNMLTIQKGYTSYLCKWNHKDVEIYTGFNIALGKTYAVAYVASKKLEKEYNSYKKQQENKNAMDGAKKF